MATTTTTVFITSLNNPFTLAIGNTISITNDGDNNHAGEGIYTSFSATNATTIGGPTIVLDGVVLDNSTEANSNEYAVQSESTADATIIVSGAILSPHLVALGINDGLIINEQSGTISGFGGIRVGTGSLGSTILNYGTIEGSGSAGVDFLNPSSNAILVNEAGGFIRGGTSGGFVDETGVYMSGGTITNAGTIEGGIGGAAIDFFANSNKNELILDPGQVLEGRASASGTTNTLELGGSGLGTLSDPGNYFGFASFVIANGADWQIGTGAAAVSITGVSTISDFGTLVIDGPITGTTINLEGSLGSPSVVDFTGSSVSNVISDFGADSTVILGGSILPTPASPSDVHLSLNTTTDLLTVTDTVGGNTLTATVQFSGVIPGSLVENVGASGIIITDLACFTAGTRILTPDGQVAVEELAVGDEVLTVRDGAARKIIWAGQRTVDLKRHAMPEKAIPVIIRAGAFGPGLPERDLRLSPDHALFIDGHLIEAKTLVNGTTVIRDRAARFVTYYHIELDRHDVILAEGLAAETYLDSGNRGNFEAGAAPLVLHPDFAAVCRDAACAPLLLDGDIVRAVRQNLLERAIALGFEQTAEIDLVAKAGATCIAAQTGATPDELLFALPDGAASVELISGTGVPAEISADPNDRRVLGAAITGLSLIAGGARTTIDLADAAHEGFHAAEEGHRWTTGHARISLPAYTGRAVLAVKLHGQSVRWQAPAERRVQAG